MDPKILSWKVNRVTKGGTHQRSFSAQMPSQSGTVVTVGVSKSNVVDVSVAGSQFQIRNGEVFALGAPQQGASSPTLLPWDANQQKVIARLPQELGYLLANVPDEPTRHALEPLIQLIRQFNAVQQVNRPGAVTYADPPYPVPPDGQVYAVPLGIEKLDPHPQDDHTGWTTVKNKATGQYERAKVYRGENVDDEGGVGYNYKICLDRGGKDSDRVIGFMQINPHEPGDRAIHVSLMGNIDPRFTGIGQALEAIKVKHMLEVRAQRSEMQTSWKALLSHASFNPHAEFVAPEFLSKPDVEKAISDAVKSGKEAMDLKEHGLKPGALGSILMHLPDDTINKMSSKKKIPFQLSLDNLKDMETATDTHRIRIGTARLVRENGEKRIVNILMRKGANLDIIELIPKGEEDRIAVMSLNYYDFKDEDGKKGLVDAQGIFHESGQPFTRYGNEVNRSHVFMEYLDIAPEGFKNEDDISALLTRIAFDISRHKGFGGRLKFEADTEPPWCEEVSSWNDGARVTDNGVLDEKDPRRNPEIFQAFVEAAVEARDVQSLCQ